MELTDSQKAQVGEWVSEGLKLSEIQSRINETFELSMTYMDVRFLVDDLNLELKDQPKPVDGDLSTTPPLAPDESEMEARVGADSQESAAADEGLSLTLHKIYKPGAVVSGDVVFSDGEKAGWALDQIGRLALNPSTEGYQPTEEDIQEFQKKLSVLLQNQGY